MDTTNHPSAQEELDASSHDRERLLRASQLSWTHWAVLAMALALAIVLWRISVHGVREDISSRFAGTSEVIVNLVQFRMHKHETALRAGAASVLVHDALPSVAQWQRLERILDLAERFPSLDGFGLVLQLPASQRGAHTDTMRLERPDYRVYPRESDGPLMPIIFLDDGNGLAVQVGFDLASDPLRREAAVAARTSGSPRITGPLPPAGQDTIPAIDFFLPVLADAEGRSSGFRGFVYAPLNIRDLVEGSLAPTDHSVAVRLLDGDQVLYDNSAELNQADWLPSPIRRTLPMYGREWTFEFTPVPAAFSGASRQPFAVLLAGFAIVAALLVLFVVMIRANRRALGIADASTVAYSRLNRSLNDANENLRDFAHSATHGLRAPVRGIASLAEWISEDLPKIDGGAAPEVTRDLLAQLDKIRERAHNLDRRIDDVLTFSEISARPYETGPISITALVSAATEKLQLPEGQPVVRSEVETLELDRARIVQILHHLFDNAIRHHDHPSGLELTFEVQRRSHHYRFVVTDNGPGIDVFDRERVFDPFAALSNADGDASGLGLPLVRRAAESIGGSAVISDAPDGGTCVVVTWPAIRIPGQDAEIAA